MCPCRALHGPASETALPSPAEAIRYVRGLAKSAARDGLLTALFVMRHVTVPVQCRWLLPAAGST